MGEQFTSDGSSGTDGTVRYSVPQMARRLGISERAVRKQIETGKLFAVKEDRAWIVILDPGTAGSSEIGTAAAVSPQETTTADPEPNTARPVVDDNISLRDEILTVAHAVPPAARSEPGTVPEADPAVSNGGTAAPIDLSPLVDLVAELTRKNAELTEAATVWQFRARHLEDQLKQITAGGISGDTEFGENWARPEGMRHDKSSSTAAVSQEPAKRSWWQRTLGLR